MTRPDPADTLAGTLARAVPDPPPMAGLAGRAEAGARRTRARRRATVGAGVLALAAVAASLVLGSQPPPPVAGEPASPAVAAAACRADAPIGAATGATAVSVRFCPPVMNQRFDNRAALVPDVALTTDVTRTVAALDVAVRDAARAFCVTRRNDYAIQVASADGSIRALSRDDCTQGYPILLEAIGRQESGLVGVDVDGVTPSCPGLESVPLRAGRVRADSIPELRTLFAVSAVRCLGSSLTHQGRTRVPAEELRAALLSSFRPAATTRCTASGRSGVQVTWVVRLSDGSTHRAELTPCGALRVDDVAFGQAGPLLRDLAAD